MAAPQVLTLEDCLQVARRHFGRDDVQVSFWKEKNLGGDKPAGYLGAHKLAEVFATSDGREECIGVFIKTIPDNDNQAMLIRTTGAFLKEARFYMEMVEEWDARGLIPKESLAERQCKGDNQDVSWGCRCYIARNNLLVLENVASLGYKSDSPRNTYDYDHVLLAFKSLATFHAASLIYEEKRSAELKTRYRIGEDLPEMIQETFYLIREGHPGKKTTEAGIVGLVECAKMLPICEKDPSARRLVEERLPGVLRRMYDAVKASPRFRNVLCHSDLWQNNIMFQYRADGRPKDIVLVDFQLLRYVPPAHDIFDLLYLTTRRSFREKYETQLLDEYYSTLGKTMKRHGIDVEKVLPRGEFDASLEEQRFAGRLAGLYVLHFVISSDEMLGPIFSDTNEYAHAVWNGEGRARLVCTQFQKDQEYRERLEECLMELLENDVFDGRANGE